MHPLARQPMPVSLQGWLRIPWCRLSLAQNEESSLNLAGIENHNNFHMFMKNHPLCFYHSFEFVVCLFPP